MTRPATVIPADEYDTLEFVAEAYGGVGYGRTVTGDDASRACRAGDPVCLVGMAWFARVPHFDKPSPIEAWGGDNWYTFHGIDTFQIDEAIKRLGGWVLERVPFADLAAELNLVRGD